MEFDFRSYIDSVDDIEEAKEILIYSYSHKA